MKFALPIAKTILIILSVGIFMQQAAAATPTTPEFDTWVRECERRNLLYSCNCECRKSALRCTNTSAGTCTESYVPGAPAVTTTSGDLILFKNLGMGVIVIVDGRLNLQATLTNLAFMAFMLIAILAVLYGIYGGYVFVTAGGNDENAQSARTIMKNALIGFIICIAAAILVVFITNLLGFDAGSANLDSTLKPGGSLNNDVDIFKDLF